MTDDPVKKMQDDSVCEWKESRQARKFPGANTNVLQRSWRAQIQAQFSLVEVPASKQTLNMEVLSREIANLPLPF